MGEAPIWCDHCGGALTEGTHTRCVTARALEPPRYCARCRRRMTVQVFPAGWTAHCSAHGSAHGPTTPPAPPPPPAPPKGSPAG